MFQGKIISSGNVEKDNFIWQRGRLWFLHLLIYFFTSGTFLLLLVTIFGSLPSLSRLRINSFFITKQKKKKKVRLVFGVGCTRVRRVAVVVAGVIVVVAVAIVVAVVVVAEEGFRAFFLSFRPRPVFEQSFTELSYCCWCSCSLVMSLIFLITLKGPDIGDCPSSEAAGHSWKEIIGTLGLRNFLW